MQFQDFIDRVEAPNRRLVVVNASQPRPVQEMLVDLFDDQPLSVDTDGVGEYDDDTVLLLEDGEVVASSPLSALMDTILLVNSDVFVTGTRGLEEVEFPDVLAGLEGVPFHLRGYPESNSEKLLLILVSRYIEQRAYRNGAGRHRASFQRLSRIDDEVGTYTVYEMLGRTDVDVHLYGIPDWVPPREFDATIHGGYHDPFPQVWFVVFVPPDGEDGHVALVAYETNPRHWKAVWTTEPDTVEEVERHVERHL